MPMFATKFDDAILPFHDREPYRSAHQKLQNARAGVDALGERLGRTRQLAGHSGPGGRVSNSPDPDPVEVAMARAGLPALETEHAIAYATMIRARRDADAAIVEAKAAVAADLAPRRREAVAKLYARLDAAAEANRLVEQLDEQARLLTGSAMGDTLSWPELTDETAAVTSLLAHRRRLLESEGWL
jgi:hypothetical protein